MAKSKKSSDEAAKTAEAPVAAPEAADPTAVEAPAPETKALVVGTGATLDLWSGVDSTFVSVLRSDLTPEQRKEAVRGVIKQSMQIEDRLNLVAGETLYEAIENEYWKDWDFTDPTTGETRKFASFDEYCLVELGMKRRKAYYLAKIYEKYVVELDVDREKLRGIEWSKARELVPVITKDNADDLLEKTKTLTTEQVKDMAKSMAASKRADGSAASPGPGRPTDEKKVTKTFRMTADQSITVSKALEVAKGISGSDDPGAQLDTIAVEFLASAGAPGSEGAMAKIDLIVTSVKRNYGVELLVGEIVDPERFAGSVAAEASAS